MSNCLTKSIFGVIIYKNNTKWCFILRYYSLCKTKKCFQINKTHRKRNRGLL